MPYVVIGPEPFQCSKLFMNHVLCRRALELVRKVCGGKHLVVCQLLQNIGNVYAAQRKYKDAIACLREALDGLNILHGVDDPKNAEVVYELGLAYAAMGSNTNAKSFLLKGLEMAPSHNHAADAQIVLEPLHS